MIVTFTFIEDESDREYISGLYEKYYRLMLGNAYEYVQDIHTAEDIVNSSVFKIYKNIKTIRSMNSCIIPSYLIRIIRSVSIDYLRKNKSISGKAICLEYEEVLDISDINMNVELEVLQKIEISNLKEYVKQLKPLERELLILKYIENMREKDIAKILEIKERNVSTYILRAKKKLIKLMMKGSGFDE